MHTRCSPPLAAELVKTLAAWRMPSALDRAELACGFWQSHSSGTPLPFQPLLVHRQDKTLKEGREILRVSIQCAEEKGIALTNPWLT